MDDRHSRLSEPHVWRLTKLIEEMRVRGKGVPNIDPNDGGIHSKVLFFLGRPGRRPWTASSRATMTTRPLAIEKCV